jgi:hypothetical protein
MNLKLFLLKMPFEDGPDQLWFCTHCALIEGALKVNPHWEEKVDVRRIDFPKPRTELVQILGEDKQWLPVLVLPNKETITDPVGITNYLANNLGGAAPHP